MPALSLIISMSFFKPAKHCKTFKGIYMFNAFSFGCIVSYDWMFRRWGVLTTYELSYVTEAEDQKDQYFYKVVVNNNIKIVAQKSFFSLSF